MLSNMLLKLGLYILHIMSILSKKMRISRGIVIYSADTKRSLTNHSDW